MIKRNFPFKILMTFMMVCLAGVGYTAPLEQMGGFWANFLIDGTLGPKKRWLYFLQIENRLRDRSPLQKSTIIRPAIGYSIAKDTALWMGYTAEPAYSSNHKWFYESNLFEQVSHTFIENKQFRLNFRFRQEQRFNNRNSGVSHRSRLRIEAVLPIHNSKWKSVVSNEFFFNLNNPKWVSSKTFAQNRVYLGLRYHYTQQQRIDFGYLNRTIFDNIETVMDHIAFIGWTLSF